MIMMMMRKVFMQCSSFHNMINQNLYFYNNFILAGLTVFNCKINIFEIIYSQLSNLNQSVDVPANSQTCYLTHDYRMSHTQPVPGLQSVKPSEMANGAIGAREAWVGSSRTRPKISLVFLTERLKQDGDARPLHNSDLYLL